MKHGAILLAQLAGNHARRAETPLTRSYTIVAPGVGPVGDHNFHGATGGSFSVHVCTLRGCSD